jgi:hypothetical protein
MQEPKTADYRGIAAEFRREHGDGAEAAIRQHAFEGWNAGEITDPEWLSGVLDALVDVRREE